MLARISPDQLAEILDIAEDGIVTVDARQEIVLFNRGAAKLFGYAPGGGRRPAARPPPPATVPRDPPRAGRRVRPRRPRRPGSMGERREVYGRRKDGTEFPAEVSISKFGAGRRGAVHRHRPRRDRAEAVRGGRSGNWTTSGRGPSSPTRRPGSDASHPARPGTRSSLRSTPTLRVTLFNPAAERVFGCPPGRGPRPAVVAASCRPAGPTRLARPARGEVDGAAAADGTAGAAGGRRRPGIEDGGQAVRHPDPAGRHRAGAGRRAEDCPAHRRRPRSCGRRPSSCGRRPSWPASASWPPASPTS